MSSSTPAKKPGPKARSRIGRALAKKKDVLLLKVSSKEQTAYPPEFKANNETVKTLIGTFQEIVKLARKYCQTATSHAKASDGVSATMDTFKDACGPDSTLGEALGLLSQAFSQVSDLRRSYVDSVQTKFIAKLEAFVANDIATARRAKNEFRKAKIQFDAASAKLEGVKARASVDPFHVFQVYQEYHYSRRKYSRLFIEADNLLSDLVNRKDFEVVSMCLGMMTAQRDFYTQTHAVLEGQREAWDRLSAQADDNDAAWKAGTEAHQQQRLQRAERAELHKYDRLVQLFSSPDLSVVNAICLSAGKAQAETLEALVRILDAHKQTLPIIKLGIVKEVENTRSPSTLFRGNSMSTKLMTAFTRLTGRPYLLSTVGDLINQVCTSEDSFEVNPSKMKRGESVEDNMDRLKRMAQAFVDSIVNSLEACPLPFRYMASLLQEEVGKRFPDARHQAVGGFIFLRFFCPAILSPDSFGVVDGKLMTKDARRPLILISKTLQNLSNNVKFGTKESYMEPLNEFIGSNVDNLYAFFDKVAHIPDGIFDYVPLTSYEEARTEHLPVIMELLLSNLDKIAKSLKQHDAEGSIPILTQILADVANPLAVDDVGPSEPGSEDASGKADVEPQEVGGDDARE